MTGQPGLEDNEEQCFEKDDEQDTSEVCNTHQPTGLAHRLLKTRLEKPVHGFPKLVNQTTIANSRTVREKGVIYRDDTQSLANTNKIY